MNQGKIPPDLLGYLLVLAAQEAPPIRRRSTQAEPEAPDEKRKMRDQESKANGRREGIEKVQRAQEKQRSKPEPRGSRQCSQNGQDPCPLAHGVDLLEHPGQFGRYGKTG